jgi:hypothetical protein
VRNNICGVTGSRSSRKEKNSSEEEPEELEESKVRTLKISGLLLVGFGKVPTPYRAVEARNWVVLLRN